MDNPRMILDLPDKADSDYVISHFRTLKKIIVINISSTATGGAILFTADNLQTLLLARTKKIFLETMEEKQYKIIMNQQVTHLLASAEEIETQLYQQYITNLFIPITDFLSKLQNITVMLTCFTLQKNNKPLRIQVENLNGFQKDLSHFTFILEDNVCFLDTLSYQIIPCLKQIIEQLVKH